MGRFSLSAVKPFLLFSGGAFFGVLLFSLYNTQSSGAAPMVKYPEQFVRISQVEAQPATLDTAIVRIESSSGAVITLVSAVHIGVPHYYKTLQEELDRHKLVLYEYVAPTGSVPQRSGGKDSGFWGMLLAHFGMQYQLEGISYDRKHFVHADLSPDQLLQAARERGEDPLTLGLGVIKDFLNSANMVNKNGSIPLNAMPQSGSDLMLLFAKTLVEQGGEDTATMKTLKPYLLDIRNQEVVRILAQKLREGHKDIAIFYGAAHMQDLIRRIGSIVNITGGSMRWVPAWNLRDSGVDARINKTLRSIKQLEHLYKLVQ